MEKTYPPKAAPSVRMGGEDIPSPEARYPHGKKGKHILREADKLVNSSFSKPMTCRRPPESCQKQKGGDPLLRVL